MLPDPCRKAMGTQEWHTWLATSWNQCPLQKFEPYEPRIVLSSYGARLLYFFYSRSPRIWHRLPPVHCQVVQKVMLYRTVRQERWLLHAVWHEETPIATVCSSGNSAWGSCAAWVHHWPGLTECSSQRHNWWTTLAAVVDEDTPPTPLWQIKIAKQALGFPDTSGQVSAINEGKFVWPQTAGNYSDERWMPLTVLG